MADHTAADTTTPGAQDGAEKFVVINACYGGFGLSEAGMTAYAARRGLTLYPEGDGLFTTWWIVPQEARSEPLEGVAWARASVEDRQASNAAYTAQTITARNIKRDDPDLLAVVALLGPAANGRFAELKIVAVPADVEWEIGEYDGREWVQEVHRTWGVEITEEQRAALLRASAEPAR